MTKSRTRLVVIADFPCMHIPKPHELDLRTKTACDACEAAKDLLPKGYSVDAYEAMRTFFKRMAESRDGAARSTCYRRMAELCGERASAARARPGPAGMTEVHQASNRRQGLVLDYNCRALVIGDRKLQLPPTDFILLTILASRRLGLAVDETYRKSMNAAREAGTCAVCGKPGHDFIDYATKGFVDEYLVHYKWVGGTRILGLEHQNGEGWRNQNLTKAGMRSIERAETTFRTDGRDPKGWFYQHKCTTMRAVEGFIRSIGAEWADYELGGTREQRGRTCLGVVGAKWESVTILGGPFGTVECGAQVRSSSVQTRNVPAYRRNRRTAGTN